MYPMRHPACMPVRKFRNIFLDRRGITGRDTMRYMTDCAYKAHFDAWSRKTAITTRLESVEGQMQADC